MALTVITFSHETAPDKYTLSEVVESSAILTGYTYIDAVAKISCRGGNVGSFENRDFPTAVLICESNCFLKTRTYSKIFNHVLL